MRVGVGRIRVKVDVRAAPVDRSIVPGVVDAVVLVVVLLEVINDDVAGRGEPPDAAFERGVIADIMSTSMGLNALQQFVPRHGTRGRVRYFIPHPNLTANDKLGLHAKFCVVDGIRAYVGSANLTGPGLSEHFEMGILIGGAAAKQIEDFWRYCIDLQLFVEET